MEVEEIISTVVVAVAVAVDRIFSILVVVVLAVDRENNQYCGDGGGSGGESIIQYCACSCGGIGGNNQYCGGAVAGWFLWLWRGCLCSCWRRE